MSLPNIILPQTETELNEPILLQIPENFAGMRIDAILAAIIPELSRNRLTNWIKLGHVLIDNEIPKPKDKAYGGETVLITPLISDEVLAFTAENIPLKIIYEDAHLIVINKPSGLTVHPGHGNWSGTLLNALLHHYPESKNIPRAGIVHRLDKDTSGLMVVARTLLAQTNLVRQLQERTVSRIYRAIVEGHPPSHGTIEKNIGRSPRNRIKMTTLEWGGKEAITHYKVLHYFDNFSYLECKLDTGRTHQIRVHLKYLGHPIVGDTLYGKSKLNQLGNFNEFIEKLQRQALHAKKLSLTHPVSGEFISWNINLPDDMKLLLEQLYSLNKKNLSNDTEEFNDLIDEDEYDI